MTSRRPAAIAILALALAEGCTPSAPPPGDAAAPAAAPAAGDRPRMFCLADPGDDGPVDRSLRAAQEAARRLPKGGEAWVSVGKQWIRKARMSSDAGFYLNAEGCVDVALQAQPGLLSALDLRGLVLMNAHRFEEARLVALEVLAREPSSAIGLGSLSDALLELGLYDESADAASRLMSTHPGMAADSRSSYLRWLNGDVPGAARHIRDALMARDTGDPEPAAWTFVEAATIYWHKGDYDGADALCAEALSWVPDYPGALVCRGRAAIAKGQPARAVPLLERAYEIRPLVETAWLLGDAHALAGQQELAEKAYADAVTQGRLGDALTLAQLYGTKGRDLEEALDLVQEECAVRGGIYVDDAEAWILHRLGRSEEARRLCDRALRLGTPDSRLLYHAGAIHIATGDAEVGRSLVSRALSLNPAFDVTGAAEARALLGAASPGAS